MSESNRNYKELAIPFFREVFELIDDVLKNRGIPYYLIGVSAIALEMLKKGIKPARGTKDIDFAIMISSLDQFEEVVNDLEKNGFNKVEAPWTMVHTEYDVVVDLLPFGDIEENNTVGFNERFTDLHVLGFKEVMKDCREYEIEDRVVNVPPIPGMVILKLVAWSDRPEDRGNDPYDILRVIEHYNDLEYENNMEGHFDLIPEDDFDDRMFSARILGRKAKTYLDESKDLETRIFEVLEANTVNAEESRIAKSWAIQKKDWDLEYCVALLEEFKAGLFEGIS